MEGYMCRGRFTDNVEYDWLMVMRLASITWLYSKLGEAQCLAVKIVLKQTQYRRTWLDYCADGMPSQDLQIESVLEHSKFKL